MSMCMSAIPPVQRVFLPYVGVEHCRCAQCDGEGVDPETVERWVDADGCLDGGGDECGRCQGTGDAPCGLCEQPSDALSSQGLCAECSTVDSIEMAVRDYWELGQRAGGLPVGMLTEVSRIAESSREWALWRDWAAAVVENRARRLSPINAADLPF